MEGNTARNLGSQPLNPYAAPADQGAGAAQPQFNNDALATRGSRLGAHMLDSLLCALAVLPLMVPGIILSGNASEGGPSFAGIAFVAASVLAMLCFQGYQWHLVATTGQSLAKRWLNIRIVNSYGDPPGFVHGVVLRSWLVGVLCMIPMVGSFVGIVDAVMIFGAEQRCLHDVIAGTRVVQS